MSLRRPIPRILVVVLLALVAALATPGRALAHGDLESTSPSDGQVLTTAPATVDLVFDDAVQVEPGSVRVLDVHQHRVDRGDAGHPPGQASHVAVSLQPNLAAGTYLVLWRVISDDSHPVSGAFTFSVGAPGAVPRSAATAGSHVVGVLLGTARFIDFVGLALLLGAVAFVVTCWPAGAGHRRLRHVVVAGWWATFAATTAGIFLQGPYGAGLGLGSVLDGDVLSETLHGRFGEASLYRLVLLLLLAMVLAEGSRRIRGPGGVDRTLTGIGALLGLGILTTVAIAGHAGDKPDAAVATGMDVVHLASMAVWLGGLATLVACLRAKDAPSLGDAVPRFSRIAAGAVLVIVGTGVYASWRDLGAWGAFTGTRQGRILLVKLGVLAALLAVAALSRRQVLRRRKMPTSRGMLPVRDARRLAASVRAEALLATGVLAVTAVLVAAPPGRSEWRPASSFNLAAGPVRVHLSVVPRGADRVDVRADTVDGSGRARAVAGLSATADQPARGITGLPLRFAPAGVGRFVATGVTLPGAGRWLLQMRVRTSIDEYRATARVTVR